MADAALDSFLENLRHLLIHHADLIMDAREHLMQLETNFQFFKSFLKAASSKKRRKDEMLKALVRDIREVIYDADDVIDAFISQAAEKKTRNYFSRVVFTGAGMGMGMGMGMRAVIEKVDTICRQISQIYGGTGEYDLVDFSITDDDQNEQPLQALPTSRKDNVVGLEDEAEKIVGYLTEETDYLDVISIVGMPGLGKTTLTAKIYHDPDIKYEFPLRIWVYVSQEFRVKEVFLSILRQMMKLNDDAYNKKGSEELAKEIAANLDNGKFLLVMDDLWEPSDWDKLKVALPKYNRMGKVVITSRQERVCLHANRIRSPHKLRFLSLEESCELLQWEVFDKPEFPPDLAKMGVDIAHKCDGLPLAIVVIAGVLTAKFSRSASAWEKVSKSVTTFLYDDPSNRMERIISLSYEALSYPLRECLLYFGMFPGDFEIPAWTLIQMWIAEGLIQPKYDTSMEETGEYYLEDLISRNLVLVDKIKADGRVKTCRIHDMIRDFCKREGGKDGNSFLQEITQSTDGGLQPLVTEGEKHRRLCIHSNVLYFLSKNPKGTYVRSFVTFCEDLEMPTEYMSAISAAFKLLRVLEAKPLKFSKLPSDFFHLVHLRYLALSLSLNMNFSSRLAILPRAFNKFWNIQTLIVHSSCPLEIKADVMSMTQLRHLKTNASTTLPKTRLGSQDCENLQTLSTMSPESCIREIFERARNLKKLAIRGKIASFLEGKIGSIDSLRMLAKLEKLKLLNDVFPLPISEGKLKGLPPPYKFPAALRSLTLVATFLEWTQMSVLASLEKLKVLKLKDNAFVGSNWTVTDGGFYSLEVLLIERTDLSIWEASAHHFPCLKRLGLHSCEKLQQVPIALADIPKFEHLDLQRCHKAAASAIKIAAKKNVPTFKLSIFPPFS